MANQSASRLSLYGLGIAALFTAAHLAWEYTHGGIQSHHLLNSPDLPAISNWWGLLLLPVLGWFACRAVAKRAASKDGAVAIAIAAFAGSLFLGGALSAAFAMGYETAASVLFFATLGAGLVLRTYRPEYAFGFVLGMTFIFGSVLPVLVASVAAGISAITHLVIRPAFTFALRRARD